MKGRSNSLFILLLRGFIPSTSQAQRNEDLQKLTPKKFISQGEVFAGANRTIPNDQGFSEYLTGLKANTFDLTLCLDYFINVIGRNGLAIHVESHNDLADLYNANQLRLSTNRVNASLVLVVKEGEPFKFSIFNRNTQKINGNKKRTQVVG